MFVRYTRYNPARLPMSDSDYTPIACRAYDDLGLRMMRGTPTTLTVQDAEANAPRTITARITDIYSADGAEYVRLDSGATVRLDRIVKVEDA